MNYSKSKTLVSIFLGILIFFSNCSDIEGEFGWAVTMDDGKGILEKANFKVTTFKMMRKNLIFSPSETIHYVYKLKWNPLAGSFSPGEEFIVALEKESLGFVEIDVKKKYLDGENYSLQDKFSKLDIGRYKLKVAYEGDVIDNVIFDVLPEEGYSIPEDSKLDDETDDIIRYSK